MRVAPRTIRLLIALASRRTKKGYELPGNGPYSGIPPVWKTTTACLIEKRSRCCGGKKQRHLWRTSLKKKGTLDAKEVNFKVVQAAGPGDLKRTEGWWKISQIGLHLKDEVRHPWGGELVKL